MSRPQHFRSVSERIDANASRAARKYRTGEGGSARYDLLELLSGSVATNRIILFVSRLRGLGGGRHAFPKIQQLCALQHSHGGCGDGEAVILLPNLHSMSMSCRNNLSNFGVSLPSSLVSSIVNGNAPGSASATHLIMSIGAQPSSSSSRSKRDSSKGKDHIMLTTFNSQLKVTVFQAATSIDNGVDTIQGAIRSS